MSNWVEFSVLQGLVLENILVEDDEILYFITNGGIFKMYHEQDCCESVYVEDVCGNPRDLIGALIKNAEESSSDEESEVECGMWTFYKIRTMQGDLTIRWYGHSNGYYGVGVDFCKYEGEIPSAAVPLSETKS